MSTPNAGASAPQLTARLRAFYRWLTPLRLLCFALLGLAAYGGYVLGVASVLVQLLVIPAVALAVDGLVGWARYRTFRFPWAGLATGLFVALLIPPQGLEIPVSSGTVLLAGAVMTAVALLAKQLFRSRNHPWFNPAALALVGAGVLFGIAPAWWGALSLPAILIAGIAVALRQPRRWVIPVSFFASYTLLSSLGSYLLLGTTDPHILLLDAIDPSVLFFTLLMVTEPRSSVANPTLQPVFGLSAGLLAGLLRLGFNGYTSLVASENLLLALLAANLFAVVLRHYDALARESRSPAPAKVRRPASAAASRRRTWGWEHRAAVAFVLIVLLGVTIGVAGTPPAPPSGPPPKLIVVSCTQDNRTISSSDLSMLHQRLGPSVIFSYNPANGATVFYDPVDHVTVYETDLFEDYGFAEFNGDDLILANGCSLGAA